MTTLQVKELIINVYDPTIGVTTGYSAWEYENGLIRVPCGTTADFFHNRHNIGCLEDNQIASIQETGTIIETTCQDLSKSWEGFCNDYGVNKRCLPLVKALVATRH